MPTHLTNYFSLDNYSVPITRDQQQRVQQWALLSGGWLAQEEEQEQEVGLSRSRCSSAVVKQHKSSVFLISVKQKNWTVSQVAQIWEAFYTNAHLEAHGK